MKAQLGQCTGVLIRVVLHHVLVLRSLQKGSIVKPKLQNKVILVDGLVLAKKIDLHVGGVEEPRHLDDLTHGVPEQKVTLRSVVQNEAVLVFIVTEVGRWPQSRVAQF